jgi:hypothetical protein
MHNNIVERILNEETCDFLVEVESVLELTNTPTLLRDVRGLRMEILEAIEALKLPRTR